MEEKQPVLKEEPLNEEQLAAQWAAAFAAMDAHPAPPPAPAAASTLPKPRRARQRSPYRHLALLITGLVCYAALVSLAALVWGGLTYLRQGDVGEATLLPLVIFFGAVFLAACLVTTLSRGGTVYPAFLLALVLNIIPFLFAEAPDLRLKTISLKLLLSLIVALFGFSVSKILYIRSRAD